MGLYGRRKIFEDQDFSNWHFAAPRPLTDHTPTGVKGLDGWRDDKVPRNIVYEVEMMETAIGLARLGLAVVHLPRFIARLHNEICRTDYCLDELKSPLAPIIRWAYLVQRSGEVETRLTKQITQALRRVCDK